MWILVCLNCGYNRGQETVFCVWLNHTMVKPYPQTMVYWFITSLTQAKTADAGGMKEEVCQRGPRGKKRGSGAYTVKKFSADIRKKFRQQTCENLSVILRNCSVTIM